MSESVFRIADVRILLRAQEDPLFSRRLHGGFYGRRCAVGCQDVIYPFSVKKKTNVKI